MKKHEAVSKWDREDAFLQQHRNGKHSNKHSKIGRKILIGLVIIIICIILIWAFAPQSSSPAKTQSKNNQINKISKNIKIKTQNSNYTTISLPTPKPVQAQ